MADETSAGQETTDTEVDVYSLSPDQLNDVLSGKDIEGKEEEEASTTEASAESAETESAAEETPAEEVAPEEKGDTVNELTAEIEKLKKQIADKEAFTQRQGNDIGKLRKQIAEVLLQQHKQPAAPAVAPEELKDKFFENPHAATQEMINEAIARRDILAKAEHIKRGTMARVIEEQVPGIREILPDVAKYMDENKIPMERRTDPYVVIAAAKSVKLARQLAELETKESKSKSKAEEALKKVNTATRDETRRVTNAPQTKESPPENVDIWSMSPTEFEKFRKEQGIT